MIYTLTVNPSLDYVMHTDIMQNHLNRSKAESIYPGGKGINVSLMLANLGCESIALGAVAGETGIFLENMLKPLIKTDFIHIKNGITRINVKVLGSNGVTEINGSGIKFDFNELKPKLDMIKNSDILVISGSFENYNMLNKIVTHVNTNKIFFDIPKIEYAIKHRPFFIKPNLSELEEYFDCGIGLNELEMYCSRLIKAGCKNILVSLGEKGAFFYNKNFVFRKKAHRGNVVNSVCSGDSMVAGVLYGIVNGLSVEESVELGVACGSATAFCEHIAKKEDIKQYYKF